MHLLLLAFVTTSGLVRAQPCSIADAEVLELPFDASVISAVRLGWTPSALCSQRSNTNNNKILAPTRLHWHLYALEELDEQQRTATSNGMYILQQPTKEPSPLVHPFLLNDGTTLAFQLSRNWSYYYNTNDRDSFTAAGISLWMPADLLAKIEVVGVNTTVRIMYLTGDNNSHHPTLTVQQSGIDTYAQVVVTSPSGDFEYYGRGVHTQAAIVAMNVASTFVDLEGVGGQVTVMNNNIHQEQNLSGRVDGVHSQVTVLGAYNEIHTSGVDPKVRVTSDCSRVTSSSSEMDAPCEVLEWSSSVVRDLLFGQEPLSCTVETTTIGELDVCGNVCWGWCFVGVMGAWSVAVVAFLILVACCCRQTKQDLKQQHVETEEANQTCDSVVEPGSEELPPVGVTAIEIDGETILEAHLRER